MNAQQAPEGATQVLAWIVEAGEAGMTPAQINDRGRRMRPLLPVALAYLEDNRCAQLIETKQHRHGRPTRVWVAQSVADNFFRWVELKAAIERPSVERRPRNAPSHCGCMPSLPRRDLDDGWVCVKCGHSIEVSAELAVAA